MKDTVIPECSEWASIWAKNRAAHAALADNLGASNVEAARAEVFEAARRYTEELKRIALDAGVRVELDDGVSPSAGIVMAGHQPVVYHSGLLFKNELLSQFALEQGACGINVVVDTDEGDAGCMVWPEFIDGAPQLREASIATPAPLFFGQKIADAVVINDVFGRMERALVSGGFGSLVPSIRRVAGLYARMSGVSVAVANSVVRWASERRAYGEVPLTEVLRLPSVSRILGTWVDDAEGFVTTYNEVLELFREERKIKNPANPFPNMKRESRGVELPLWAIDSLKGTRRPVYSTGKGSSALQETEVLAPRGSIVTLLLRGIVSDLFIHGLGGAKYDPFVDAFAARRFGAQLPRFVVASKTRYLFSTDVQRYEGAIDLDRRYKEVVSHTEKFLEVGLFEVQEVVALKNLVASRPLLLAQLRSASSPEERSATSHKLNALNREIRAYLDQSSLTRLLTLARTPEPIVKAWLCREFPFFLFGE